MFALRVALTWEHSLQEHSLWTPYGLLLIHLQGCRSRKRNRLRMSAPHGLCTQSSTLPILDCVPNAFTPGLSIFPKLLTFAISILLVAGLLYLHPAAARKQRSCGSGCSPISWSGNSTTLVDAWGSGTSCSHRTAIIARVTSPTATLSLQNGSDSAGLTEFYLFFHVYTYARMWNTCFLYESICI